MEALSCWISVCWEIDDFSVQRKTCGSLILLNLCVLRNRWFCHKNCESLILLDRCVLRSRWFCRKNCGSLILLDLCVLRNRWVCRKNCGSLILMDLCVLWKRWLCRKNCGSLICWISVSWEIDDFSVQIMFYHWFASIYDMFVFWIGVVVSLSGSYC